MRGIESAIRTLVADPDKRAYDFEGIDDVCCIRSVRHVAFGLRGTRPLSVVAILHERMDLLARLARRLP